MANYPNLKSQDKTQYIPFDYENNYSSSSINIDIGEYIKVITLYPVSFESLSQSISYSWYFDNELTEETSNIYYPQSSGSVYCKISFEQNSYTLDTLNINVNSEAAPSNVQISNYVSDTNMLTNGDSLSLTCSYTDGGLPCTVEWILETKKGYEDWQPLSTTNNNSNSYSMIVNEGLNQDRIRVKVTNSKGSTYSEPVYLHVKILNKSLEFSNDGVNHNVGIFIFNDFDWNYYVDELYEDTQSESTTYKLSLMKDIKNKVIKKFYTPNTGTFIFDGMGCILDNITLDNSWVNQSDTWSIFSCQSSIFTDYVISNLGLKNINVTNSTISGDTYFNGFVESNLSSASGSFQLTNCFIENLNINSTLSGKQIYLLCNSVSNVENCYIYNTTIDFDMADISAMVAIEVHNYYIYKGNYTGIDTLHQLPDNDIRTNNCFSEDDTLVDGSTVLDPFADFSGVINLTSDQMQSNYLTNIVGSEFYFDSYNNEPYTKLNIFNREIYGVFDFSVEQMQSNDGMVAIISEDQLVSGYLTLIVEQLPKNTDYSITWKSNSQILEEYNNFYNVPFADLITGSQSTVEVVINASDWQTPQSISALIQVEMDIEPTSISTHTINTKTRSTNTIDFSDDFVYVGNRNNLSYEIISIPQEISEIVTLEDSSMPVLTIHNNKIDSSILNYEYEIKIKVTDFHISTEISILIDFI